MIIYHVTTSEGPGTIIAATLDSTLVYNDPPPSSSTFEIAENTANRAMLLDVIYTIGRFDASWVRKYRIDGSDLKMQDNWQQVY